MPELPVTAAHLARWPCTEESDDLIPAVHLVKEGVIVSKTSRGSDKFMQGIKVLMAKNDIDNLREEVKKGQCEKAATRLLPEQGMSKFLVRRPIG